LQLTISFDDEMDQTALPAVSFNPDASASLSAAASSTWLDAQTARLDFTVVDANEDLGQLNFTIESALDAAGNALTAASVQSDICLIDTDNPSVESSTPSLEVVACANAGTNTFTITYVFDQDMDQTIAPVISFPNDNLQGTLVENASSAWLNATTYVFHFDAVQTGLALSNIDVAVSNARDIHQNLVSTSTQADVFDIDMCIGVTEIELAKVVLFPNPSNGLENVSVSAPFPLSNWQVTVFDITGKMIWSKPANQSAGNILQLPTQNLSNGQYMVRMERNGLSTDLKFTIAR
jgi:hypothetical protein